MTLSGLEGALAWLGANRLAGSLHLLDGVPGAPGRHASTQRGTRALARGGEGVRKGLRS